MNKSYSDFILLLRNSLSDNNKKNDSFDVDEIEKIASNHLCLSLVCAGVIKSGMILPEKWKQHMLLVVANNYKNLSVQSKIISILKSNNIKCAILKGISVSKHYPEPLYRALGDIDILVEEKEYEKAINLFVDSDDRKNDKHKFHYQFEYEGISVEIHKHITEYADDEYGRFINNYLKQALYNINQSQYDGFVFPILEIKFQVISLVLHTQRHFFEHKTTMRMICDFAMLTQSIDLAAWNKEIYPALVELKLNIFTSALLGICYEYLGIDCINKIKDNVEESIIKQLILELLNDGILPLYTDIQNIGVVEKFKNILFTINDIIKRDFKFIEKRSILLPVFYIYVPLRSLCRKFTGKRKNIDISGYGVSYSRRTLICKKLNLRD